MRVMFVLWDNATRSIRLNGLESVCKTLDMAWGVWTASVISIPRLDVLLAADCLYDPKDFDSVFATIAYFIERDAGCQVWMTYQNRRHADVLRMLAPHGSPPITQ